MTELLSISVSLLPVLVFLVGLVYLDSFKLVRPGAIVRLILIGCAAALVSLLLCVRLQGCFDIGTSPYTRYVAPPVEEVLKALPVIYVITRRRIGFMVDAAIAGFAVGAGFALVENIYYLHELGDPSLLVWIVRGFGTAVMHGGTTAVFAVLSKGLADRREPAAAWVFVPGFLLAAGVHSGFNHFILPPLVHTVAQLIVLPILVIVTFTQSERKLRDWLEAGLDSDVRMLDYITTGTISETRAGKYLHLLRSRFSGEIVADMLCFLRIHLELAVRAKGLLMMREAGFRIHEDTEVKEKLAELKFLEASIGRTGKLALSPILHTGNRRLWELHVVRGQVDA